MLRHYIRKSRPTEVKEAKKHPHIISNEDLANKLTANDKVTVIDVREPAEYSFNRIPGAISIPLGELEDRVHELNTEDEIYVVCRTGNRSDMACRMLSEKGFKQVKNVEPGMSGWTGPMENTEK
ncbi:Thiosulfate sulfurtransferase PspE precursor [compost metagenome]